MKAFIEDAFTFIVIVTMLVLTTMYIIEAWTDSEPTEVIGGMIYKLIS